MKTLYISDLDGTLLQPDVTLSNQTVAILNDLIEKGMLFSVATARTIASVKSILEDVNINLPIILMNGVCIYDLHQDKYINVETITKESVNLILSICKQMHQKGFVYTIDSDGTMSTYYEELNSKALQDFYQERVDKYQKRFTQVDNFDCLSDSPVVYFCFIDLKENLEPVLKLIEQVPNINCVFYKDNYSTNLWYLEVFSKHASKYHAVQFIRNYLNVDSIVCFGDNKNDFSLFEASDHTIAVSNAIPELKERADIIIGSNIEDGVALWLKNNGTVV